MKFTKKLIFLAFFTVLIAENVFAQATIAKLNFEEAEEAYNKGEYEKTLSKLEQAEKNFGKINPPILHLRVVAQYKLLETSPKFNLYNHLLQNCKVYMANYAEIEDLIDKTREVYKINEALQKYPGTENDFNTYALRKIKEIENDAKLNKYLTVKNYVGDMVYVEGGTFDMGSNNGNKDEKPVRKVIVNSFYIGKYEVTKAQWKAIIGELPPFNGQCDDCPVAMIVYPKALEFIEKLNAITGKNFRLPTEAEWEYAARGGNRSKGYVYSGSDDINEVAFYAKTISALSQNNKTTQRVGKLKPNELGIYDMSGNVKEWCSDWYGDYIATQTNNPNGAPVGKRRVIRGGAYGNKAEACSVSNRENWFISTALYAGTEYIGLRLVAE